MHLALANGFVAQTYLPLLRHFEDSYRLLSLVPRALWGDGAPPPPTYGASWSVYGHDMLAGMQTFQLENVLAVGHSFGGVASLLAALQKPDVFRGLILLDPTALAPRICEAMRQARDKSNVVAAHPLAEKARRRRRVFESVDAMFNRFRQKEVFAQWSDEALRLYVEYGTVARDDGKRILTWSPDWEAYYYSTPYIDIWERLPELDALSLPKLIITGEHSDIYTPESLQKMRDLVPSATYHVVEDHGHLFPQSAPQTTADLIRGWLSVLA
jgi:pimeloyl-ACP methyl ester carboxylesterase